MFAMRRFSALTVLCLGMLLLGSGVATAGTSSPNARDGHQRSGNLPPSGEECNGPVGPGQTGMLSGEQREKCNTPPKHCDAGEVGGGSNVLAGARGQQHCHESTPPTCTPGMSGAMNAPSGNVGGPRNCEGHEGHECHESGREGSQSRSSNDLSKGRGKRCNDPGHDKCRKHDSSYSSYQQSNQAAEGRDYDCHESDQDGCEFRGQREEVSGGRSWKCEDDDEGWPHKPHDDGGWKPDHGHNPRHGSGNDPKDHRGDKPKWDDSKWEKDPWWKDDKDVGRHGGYGKYRRHADNSWDKAGRQHETANRWWKRGDRYEHKADRNWDRYHDYKGRDWNKAKVYRAKAKRYDREAERCNDNGNEWNEDADVSREEAARLIKILKFLVHLLEDCDCAAA